jgi:hypothetical protein
MTMACDLVIVVNRERYGRIRLYEEQAAYLWDRLRCFDDG